MSTSTGVHEFCSRLSTALAREPTLANRTHVPKGGTVYNSGDRDQRMYIVEVGQLKTMTTAADGKQCLLSIHTPRDTFGELGLLDGPRQETAIAMKHSVLRQINYAKLLAILAEDELMNRHFTHFLMSRMLDQQLTITQLVTMDSEHRLAATLLRIARKLGRRAPTGVYIDIRLTQEDLSSMVGTTRSRVGLFLKNFRENRLLDPLPGGFMLVREEALAAYVERDLEAALTTPAVPEQECRSVANQSHYDLRHPGRRPASRLGTSTIERLG
ncbi:Crp/Fnr family transcriptional regulator [Actinosynnema sp. NPDC047251]|uniref:Cyclic nucleotide-binding protein n=1 Tax=Saccharothrix espanaensis (strain ATCC 51144 / DSM 44229 / JCM 9112 / NBRC 15066 / NRRL 15764) TaxID=1179773 RepID=K0K4U8_SACES|nr:Crp/Fnr family transcriptional regulator [Saccharothrix espanaensis]CCH31904.1 Cyclic nucleotide-binding protein [Saccharothrix espanaensis DSM 44229]